MLGANSQRMQVSLSAESVGPEEAAAPVASCLQNQAGFVRNDRAIASEKVFPLPKKRSRKLKRILWEGKGLPASSRQDQTNNGGLIACSATKWNCSPATSLPSLRCLSDLQQSSTSESFLLRIRCGRPILGFRIFPSKAAIWALIQRGI